MFAAYVISLALLGLSGYLIDSHRRGWHAAHLRVAISDRDLRFARSMYRRRMQASATIGVIGAGIGVWPLVPRLPEPLALYTAILLAACAWLMVMALLDVWATQRHYRQLRTEQLTQQLQLAVEMVATQEAAEAESA